MSKKIDLSELRKTLPPFIARKKIAQYLGGIYTAQYLANLNARDEGPTPVKIGRNVGYLRDDLVNWLEARMSMEE